MIFSQWGENFSTTTRTKTRRESFYETHSTDIICCTCVFIYYSDQDLKNLGFYQIKIKINQYLLNNISLTKVVAVASYRYNINYYLGI